VIDKKLKKRKWIYVCKPQKYDITCNKCGGVNIEWSEYEHKIWCYECKEDLPGTPGIFDGPIPIGTMEILGAPLWRIYLKSQAVCKPVITKAGRVVYRKMKKTGGMNGREVT